MALRLSHSGRGDFTSYYVVQDFRNPETGSRTTRTYQKFGQLRDLLVKYGVSSKDEVETILKQEVLELRKNFNEKNEKIKFEIDPSEMVPVNHSYCYPAGYLYCQKVLSMLGLKKTCDHISDDRKFQYNLYEILNMLVCTRIISPASKLASVKSWNSYFHTDPVNLHDVYRALPILAENRYEIEADLYKASTRLVERDTSVLYYDCTNFFFEITEEDEEGEGIRRFGKSKEERTAPVVQYGLFTDANGIPLLDTCFEGNKNEQQSLRPAEKQIEKDFKISRFVICADAGLNSFENKLFNDRKENGAFIVTQPIKKLKKDDRETALNPTGWRVLNSNRIYDLTRLPEEIEINGNTVPVRDVVFYKEFDIITERKSQETGKKEKLKERLIVSYSEKYKARQEAVRNKKMKAAESLLRSPGKIKKTTNPSDPKYYITSYKYDNKTGEITEGDKSQSEGYMIDWNKVTEEARFDGFYAVTTDLQDDDIGLIIQANKNRWQIEECFEIMKSELAARPIYVSLEESIKGHLLTCFIALLVVRIIERHLEEKYTMPQLFESLQNIRLMHVSGPNYLSAFRRTQLTDDLAKIYGYQMSYRAMNEKELFKYCKNSRSPLFTQYLKSQKSR